MRSRDLPGDKETSSSDDPESTLLAFPVFLEGEGKFKSSLGVMFGFRSELTLTWWVLGAVPGLAPRETEALIGALFSFSETEAGLSAED